MNKLLLTLLTLACAPAFGMDAEVLKVDVTYLMHADYAKRSILLSLRKAQDVEPVWSHSFGGFSQSNLDNIDKFLLKKADGRCFTRAGHDEEGAVFGDVDGEFCLPLNTFGTIIPAEQKFQTFLTVETGEGTERVKLFNAMVAFNLSRYKGAPAPSITIQLVEKQGKFFVSPPSIHTYEIG